MHQDPPIYAGSGHVRPRSRRMGHCRHLRPSSNKRQRNIRLLNVLSFSLCVLCYLIIFDICSMSVEFPLFFLCVAFSDTVV